VILNSNPGEDKCIPPGAQLRQGGSRDPRLCPGAQRTPRAKHGFFGATNGLVSAGAARGVQSLGMRSIVTLVFLAPIWTPLIQADPQRRPVVPQSEILAPGKDWELLGQGYQLTADTAVDREGLVYFTDARNDRILKIDFQGKITIWKENSGGAHGIAYGPDGRLYAGQHDRKRIVALTPDGKESIVAEGVQTHHLAVTERNEVYFADAPNHKIWLVDVAGNKRAVSGDLNWPHGIRASPDQSLVAVTDPHTSWVWTFRIQRDGSLDKGRPFYRLQTPDGSSETDAGGMTFDTAGFLYVATTVGVQVYDPAGRAAAILNPPGRDGVSDVFFGGPDMQWLFVTDGDRVYRRLSTRRGAAASTSAKPVGPRL
jgi:gluconolactonase